MRISELIAHLQSIQAEHGDLECDTIFNHIRVPLEAPRLAYRKMLLDRERSCAFWWPLDGEIRKGEKVVRF